MRKTGKSYIRDSRSPVPKDSNVSEVMRANMARNTKPELILRKALWHAGHRGYRLHWKGVPGKPDIAYPGQKVAIFVNGCYWHRCPKCNYSLPKHNRDFWKEKFKKNVERDKRKSAALKALHWSVLTVWECEIKKNLEQCVIGLSQHLKSKRNG